MRIHTLLSSSRRAAVSALAILTISTSVLVIAAEKTFQIDGAIVPFNKDGIHDPRHEAIGVYQHPKDALTDFPRTSGGVIDWVKALDEKKLVARSDKNGLQTTKAKDLDIVMKATSSMPHVKFPHRQHTELLTCGNCHPDIFIEKTGANDISMNIINSGKSCGVCHGKVAFPPNKDCARCHSVATDTSLQLKK